MKKPSGNLILARPSHFNYFVTKRIGINQQEEPERPAPAHPRRPEITPPGTPLPDVYPQKSPEVYPNPGNPEVSPNTPSSPEIYPQPSPQINPGDNPPEISG